GEAVVDGDERKAFRTAEVEQVARKSRSAAHDQRAAVDPGQHRPGLRGLVAIDVELDLEAPRLLVDERLLGKRRGGGLKGGDEKDRRDHFTYFRAPEPGAADAGVRT